MERGGGVYRRAGVRGRAVAGLTDEDFERPSGCRGRLVRDLVCRPVVDAQGVLITLVGPADTEQTADATTCWNLAGPPGPATTGTTAAVSVR
ncbi:hypothetical protein ACH4VX_01660 [Streptomyces sp. NPDC020731]|uniref:hypothetical protein n=1 Tax=Streptomyces sp. NPDC020731 TaxID=3365085 RepID=UPI0037BAAC0E